MKCLLVSLSNELRVQLDKGDFAKVNDVREGRKIHYSTADDL